MFKGGLPADAISIISEIINSWTCSDIHIGCCGNMTIERSIVRNKLLKIHSNDVSMYSCALGRYFSGIPNKVSIKEDSKDQWGWLEQYLDTPINTVATIMICTSMFDGLGKNNAYYNRMAVAYMRQWPRIHADTVKKLGSLEFRIDSFYAGDAVDWVKLINNDQGFVSFPIGVDHVESPLDQVFDWEKPEYVKMTEVRKKEYLELILKKKFWIYGFNSPVDELEPYLKGCCKTVSKGVKIYIYGSHGVMRRVDPKIGCEGVSIPRLTEGMKIGEKLTIGALTSGEFKTLRSQYLNVMIVAATAPMSYGVYVDGLLVGCFALNTIYRGIKEPNEHSPHVYLYSDFAVAPTNYPRLSKLIIYAVLSHEGRLLAEGMAKRRTNGVITTAFSKNPISMKYRGLLESFSRVRDKEDKEWIINYHGPMGRWSLDEGFALWKNKYGKEV
jgi:hypothetical protein